MLDSLILYYRYIKVYINQTQVRILLLAEEHLENQQKQKHEICLADWMNLSCQMREAFGLIKPPGGLAVIPHAGAAANWTGLCCARNLAIRDHWKVIWVDEQSAF